jgi:AcrR family transcriptional regulator
VAGCNDADSRSRSLRTNKTTFVVNTAVEVKLRNGRFPATLTMKPAPAVLDPRIKRTRQLLHRAFNELLAEKSFDEITVHDIAERSTVNRATFYDHFPDKFALLEDIIAESFQDMLEVRMAGSIGTCPESVKQLICAVCDFFADMASGCQKHQRQFAPVAESKIKSLLRDFLLIGLRQALPEGSRVELELRAIMASWAICGAALEWSHAKSSSLEDFADSVFSLVSTTLNLQTGASSAPPSQSYAT